MEKRKKETYSVLLTFYFQTQLQVDTCVHGDLPEKFPETERGDGHGPWAQGLALLWEADHPGYDSRPRGWGHRQNIRHWE